MTIETCLLLGGIALILVVVNFGLLRLARPDKGNDPIAGCCGTALPEEMLQTLSQLEEIHER